MGLIHQVRGAPYNNCLSLTFEVKVGYFLDEPITVNGSWELWIKEEYIAYVQFRILDENGTVIQKSPQYTEENVTVRSWTTNFRDNLSIWSGEHQVNISVVKIYWRCPDNPLEEEIFQLNSSETITLHKRSAVYENLTQVDPQISEGATADFTFHFHEADNFTNPVAQNRIYLKANMGEHSSWDGWNTTNPGGVVGFSVPVDESGLWNITLVVENSGAFLEGTFMFLIYLEIVKQSDPTDKKPEKEPEDLTGPGFSLLAFLAVISGLVGISVGVIHKGTSSGKTCKIENLPIPLRD